MRLSAEEKSILLYSLDKVMSHTNIDGHPITNGSTIKNSMKHTSVTRSTVKNLKSKIENITPIPNKE